MGTYLEVGVCTHLRLSKSALAQANLSKEQAVQRITDEGIDLAMFVESDQGDGWQWALHKELIERDLVPFLRAQYALIGIYDDESTEAMLNAISQKKTYKRILAFAKRQDTRMFRARTHDALLQVGLGCRWLPVEFGVLEYLAGGKAFLEEWQMFGYFEELIHQQKSKFPIARAVKVFLD